jgi:hypothetical protein
MKRLSILFLSVMTLGLSISGCSNDDENNASIEGKWELAKVGTVVSGKELLIDIPTFPNKCGKDYLDFVKGGVLNDYSFSDSDSEDCTKPVETAVWTVSAKKLNIKYNIGSNADYEILELSNSTLKIKETDQEGVYILLYTKRK